MNSALPDTSLIIAAWRGDSAALASLEAPGRLVLSPVVVGELLVGLTKHRPSQVAKARRFFDAPGVEHVPLTRHTAERYAAIARGLASSGNLVPANDIWIAASAMEHGLVVITLDQHFLRIPQILVEFLGEPAAA